jgi:hypothetical protein
LFKIEVDKILQQKLAQNKSLIVGVVVPEFDLTDTKLIIE